MPKEAILPSFCLGIPFLAVFILTETARSSMEKKVPPLTSKICPGEMIDMRAIATPMLRLFEPSPLVRAEPIHEYAVDYTRDERARAEQLASRETWRPFPARQPTSQHDPYTLAWFEDIERRRYARHGRWIPKLFGFKRHRGDRVLCLGDGLGTDWVQFALSGANVHHCSPAADSIALTQLNFEVRGLKGAFHRSPLDALPFPTDTMDVVCLSGMTAAVSPFEPIIGEIFRVLRPGGKLLAALPARYDAAFWQLVWFPWQRLYANRGPDEPFSARMLKRYLKDFNEPRIHKRHLRRSDIPHIWRWMLLPALERMMGRYLVVKTFKPLTSSMTVRMAA